MWWPWLISKMLYTSPQFHSIACPEDSQNQIAPEDTLCAEMEPPQPLKLAASHQTSPQLYLRERSFCFLRLPDLKIWMPESAFQYRPWISAFCNWRQCVQSLDCTILCSHWFLVFLLRNAKKFLRTKASKVLSVLLPPWKDMTQPFSGNFWGASSCQPLAEKENETAQRNLLLFCQV